MDAAKIQDMAERVSVLLTERMRIKGDDLADKLIRADRRLPRKVRKAGEQVATALERSFSPKLMLQIDEAALAENYKICITHLEAVNKGHKLRGILLDLSTSLLFSLAGVVALVLGVLFWRGFL